MTCYISTFTLRFGPSPALPFSVAVDAAGAVVATAFGEADQLARRTPLEETAHSDRHTRHVRDALEAYAAGERRDFQLALAPAGSPFQQRVWAALRQIPYGSTRSYGALARELGSSARAIGRANATNPICLIVPCHRVIGADGTLTGFAFGEAIKHTLLVHEGALAEAQLPLV
jgi:methylated-DNA-[protein]-cysteine S-methyltransferase